MKPKPEKFLLYPAEDDVDEDDGLTLLQHLRQLARDLGYSLHKIPAPKPQVLNTIQANRIKNLEWIVNAQFNGRSGHLADRLGMKRPGIYRFFSTGKSARQMGEALARVIESKLGLPVGWMDERHKRAP